MDWERSYFDLCTEIDILEIRLDNLNSELRHLMRQINNAPRTKLVANYSGMPSCGMDTTPLDKRWNEICQVQAAIAEIEDVISLKTEAKKRMEAKMNEFEGLEYQVAYMRDIKRLPLYKIAEELKYSENWIYKISSKIGKFKARNDCQTAI